MEFNNTSAYVPLSSLVEGMTSLSQFEENERYLQEIATFRNKGLTDAEILLYYQNKNGNIQSRNIEQTVLEEKLKAIEKKIEDVTEKSPSDKLPIEQAETNNSSTRQTSVFYPTGHPMNSITELEDDLFGHLDVHNIAPITKRRKILRRLTRKEEKCSKSLLGISTTSGKVENSPSLNKQCNPNLQGKSKWDVQQLCDYGFDMVKSKSDSVKTEKIVIGPKRETIYTIRDNRIVRVEPLADKQYRTVELKVPVNKAEEKLLEGSKISMDDIRELPKFHNYHPGVPSKVLFIKNISPAVTVADLEEKFKSFTQDVRLMSGRMKGQAFIHMRDVATATCALEQTNGTIMKGKPIIIMYGKSEQQSTNGSS